MNLKSALSSRLLLMLSLTVPTVLLSAVGGAVAQSATQLGVVASSQKVQPFITADARRDTLQNLNRIKISPVILQGNDGGTGKESSDKGKDASDKGKDACDACPEAGLFNKVSNPDPLIRDNQPILNQPLNTVPSNVLFKGTQIR
ncbi:hypothetical protein A6770_16930 [Nostoc minutum NIES-26]|uniref:Uncharacterized protein n=1 Tax=Nostoc minutum NIES-26 TaxID=1844469 RepID=A0A367RDY0_9NOSO|nr:hypothetical protein [Dendronalium sp. ChiSLP03b]MDZ8208131.1 hypothetical protein [Dendronalium sp. ChiSLP03b]RCJ34746.1 hypothetical protein A6770_16930 [Nostoc minutum NIES-26]